jgi:transposase
MNKRLCPIYESFFSEKINSLIVGSYSAAGRPQRITNYQLFCAALYVLRTGSSWRDLPKVYCYWHSLYLRFKKSSDRGLWWKVLQELQRRKVVTINFVMADSATMKVHRHGGGLKG